MVRHCIALFFAFFCSTATCAGAHTNQPTKPVYALWVADTGQVIEEQNDGEPRPMASITKVMTSLVILRSGVRLDEVVTVTGSERSRALRRGMRLTRLELLELALVASDNLAARTLAETWPAGYNAFISEMNATAVGLGMADTRYSDATGLSSSNVTTVADLHRLLVVGGTWPLYSAAANTAKLKLEAKAQGRRKSKPATITVANTNRFAGQLDLQVAKTGYTEAAGRCLVMLVNSRGSTYYLAVLGASNPQARTKMVEYLLDRIK